MGSPLGALLRTAVPRPGAATTAFQPTRPGNVPSRRSTRRAPSAGAVRASSSRVVGRPPAPSGNDSRGAPAGSSATLPPVDLQLEPAGDLGELSPEHLRAAEALLLCGRDLGLVEHVAHVHPVGRDAHHAQVVHGEVAERVGRRRRRRHRERGEHRDSEERAASPERLPGLARLERGQHPAAAQGQAQVRRRFRPAGRRGGDAGVEAEQRIARAQPQCLVCPAQAGAPGAPSA